MERIMNLIKLGVLLAAATLSLNAFAGARTHNDGCTVCDPDKSIFGSDFKEGKSTYTAHNFIPDVDATFTSSGGTFQKKTQDGFTGVGVSGKTAGEIDIGESITGSFSQNIIITNISLGLLFDGPEYGDVQETAKITATFLGGATKDYFLTATGLTTATWTGLGSVTNISPAANGQGALWSISNPFGDALVSSLSFTAVAGLCGSGSCNNQSDFVLYCISAVPEPSTYALLMAGVAAVGYSARRKAKQVTPVTSFA